MKALTIIQPFAYLIAAGIKTIENRSWPSHHRGTMIIHAGKNERYVRDDAVMERICDTVERVNRIAMNPESLRDHLVYGAIIGRCEVTACSKLEEVMAGNSDRDKAWVGATADRDKAWAEGPWCWLLDEPWELEKPIPWRGRQGLFDIPVEAFRTLREFASTLEDVDG